MPSAVQNEAEQIAAPAAAQLLDLGRRLGLEPFEVLVNAVLRLEAALGQDPLEAPAAAARVLESRRFGRRFCIAAIGARARVFDHGWFVIDDVAECFPSTQSDALGLEYDRSLGCF